MCNHAEFHAIPILEDFSKVRGSVPLQVPLCSFFYIPFETMQCTRAVNNNIHILHV